MLPLVLVGLSVVLLLGWHRQKDVAELLGLGFGFGLVVLPFLGYLRLPSLIVSVVFFAGVLFYRLLPGRRVKVNWKSLEGWLCILVVVFLSFLFLLNLGKNPVFPLLDVYTGRVSIDFMQNLKLALDVLGGNFSLDGGFASSHLTYASLLNVSDAIRSYREVSFGIAALSPLLVYLLVYQVAGSRLTGVFAAFLYASTSPLWYHFVFSAGLMPNFLSLLLSFFTLYLSLTINSWRSLPLLGLSSFILFTSHMSAPLVLPALLLSVFAGILRGRKSMVLKAVFISSALVVVFTLILPRISGFLEVLIGGVHFYRYTPTLLTQAFNQVLYLQNLTAIMQTDITFILYMGGAGGFVYGFWKDRERRLLYSLMAVWVLTYPLLTGMFTLGWRAVYPSLAPLSVIAPIGIVKAVSPLWNRIGYTRRFKVGRAVKSRWVPSMSLKMMLALLLAGLVFYGGQVHAVGYYSLRFPNLNATNEDKVNMALQYVREVKTGTYIAVGEARFEYLYVWNIGVLLVSVNIARTEAGLLSLRDEALKTGSYVIATRAFTITPTGRLLGAKANVADAIIMSNLFEREYDNGHVAIFKAK